MSKNHEKYIEGVTKTGFRYHVSREAMDDMEIIDLLAELEDDKITAIPKLIEKLLGPKQKEALYDHCKNKQNRIPSSRIMNELKDIMTNPNLKKS